MWYLIGLVWLALVIGIFWAYGRKRSKQAGVRAREMDALISEFKLNPAAALVSTSATAATLAAAAPVANPLKLPEAPQFGKKAKLLAQPQALLYYVFRTGLPDHEIFVNLTLADVIDIDPVTHAYEVEQRARRLAQQRLDLVICTKQLEVIAAVIVDSKTTADTLLNRNAHFADECLRSAGIRLVRVDATAPLRHQQVRDLVYGTTA
jgi:hypothetical protein